MAPFTHHFKIHSCEKDKHFHIITSEVDISAPFWTFFGGIKTIERISRAMYCDTPSIHHRFLSKEVREIRDEIWNLSQTFRKNGFSQLQPRELTVEEAWSTFQNGETGTARYPSNVCDTPKRKDMLPFICDFVNRPSEVLTHLMPEDGYSRRVLRMLAYEKAWPKSAKDLELEIIRTEFKRKEQVA